MTLEQIIICNSHETHMIISSRGEAGNHFTRIQSIHQKFLQKNFEIQKCCMSFSLKVIDQAREQLYEMINGRCGAIAQSTYIAEVDADRARHCEDD